MARNTRATSCHSASADACAEAGSACSPCARNNDNVLGISLLVSIFVILSAAGLAAAGAAVPAVCILFGIIIAFLVRLFGKRPEQIAFIR